MAPPPGDDVTVASSRPEFLVLVITQKQERLGEACYVTALLPLYSSAEMAIAARHSGISDLCHRAILNRGRSLYDMFGRGCDEEVLVDP